MQSIRLIFFVILLVATKLLIGHSQSIQWGKYEFISSKNDTVDAELGRIVVVENRTISESDSIGLSFVRFKSFNPNPSSPIIYLAGGPGGYGINTAKGNEPSSKHISLSPSIF